MPAHNRRADDPYPIDPLQDLLSRVARLESIVEPAEEAMTDACEPEPAAYVTLSDTDKIFSLALTAMTCVDEMAQAWGATDFERFDQYRIQGLEQLHAIRFMAASMNGEK